MYYFISSDSILFVFDEKTIDAILFRPPACVIIDDGHASSKKTKQKTPVFYPVNHEHISYLFSFCS